MAKQLLIYETAVPVSAARHANVSLDVKGSFAFSAGVNAVPVMAVEIPRAADEYAIVFSMAGADVMPAVVLGMKAQQNLYLNAESRWQAKYIPAFIRRYPFVFANGTGPDGKATLTLCVDESHAGINREGRGQRFFADDGKATPFMNEVMKFVQECQVQFDRTTLFGKQIKDLGILEPMQAKVTGPGGQPLAEGNFLAVSREKLHALDDATLGKLARNGVLELIYLHLQSLRNFEAVKEKLVGTMGAAGTATAATVSGGLH